MREEIVNWWKQAEKDLKAANDSFKTDNLDWASFQAQQAAEKALKALFLKKYKKLIKTHDLFLLAKRLDSPEEITTLCKKLSPVYVETRYPDVQGGWRKFSREEVREDIENAEKIVQWVKKIL